MRDMKNRGTHDVRASLNLNRIICSKPLRARPREEATPSPKRAGADGLAISMPVLCKNLVAEGHLSPLKIRDVTNHSAQRSAPILIICPLGGV